MHRFALALSAVFLVFMGSVPGAAAQTTAYGPSEAATGFARALATDGETVFVGESQHPHAPGGVYVYTRTDDGAWASETRLQADDAEVGDGFGRSLALDGSSLAVGASSSSAVYLFDASDDGWMQSDKLTPSDSLSGFGSAVAMSGDVLAVASRSRRAPGQVVVFERGDDGAWTQMATLSQSGSRSGFGSALAVHDGQVLVGAPNASGGQVVVYRPNDDGEWTEAETINAGPGGASNFGVSLTTASTADGEMLVAGAPRVLDATGVAYAFRYDAEAEDWMQVGSLLPFDGATRHGFGSSVTFDGSHLWIGAPGAGSQTGALYRFGYDAETGAWTGTERVNHPDAMEGDQLGTTLAAAGDLVATGLTGDDHGAGTMAVFTQGEDGSWSASDVIAPEADMAGLQAVTGEEQPCTDGDVEGFSCNNVDLLSFLPVSEVGGERGVRLNDVWGWTDPETGREYALVGRIEGTSFVDVTDPTNPVYLGNLPKHEGSRTNVWRDVKVYDNHAYVVADNAGEAGMQVFDLTQLRDVTPGEPETFEETAHYDGVHSAHNVVINQESGFAYIVGASGGGNTCGGGLHMVNVQEPANPQFAGCFADPSTGRTGTGYSHDAQCVIYDGPDTEHQGREICIGANETAISIADVTDKDNPKALSTASYPNYAYVHQGWLTEDHRYFYVNDELDEINGIADSTRTLIWDLSDLDDPQLVKEYFLSEPSTDHNLYVKGQTMYQSNYVSGLRVLDVSDPENPKEVGHLDTVPFGDNSAGFGGSWSNYPFFESGTVVVTSMDEGLFLIKKSQQGL